jgi:hypothetical protein
VDKKKRNGIWEEWIEEREERKEKKRGTTDFITR